MDTQFFESVFLVFSISGCNFIYVHVSNVRIVSNNDGKGINAFNELIFTNMKGTILCISHKVTDRLTSAFLM